MTVAVIVQARVGSSRLRGKVLMEVGGSPMLLQVVERARRIHPVDEVFVATTMLEEDEPIVTLCRAWHIPVFRGHPTDVLDRYYNLAMFAHPRVILRVTGDCPLLNPKVSTMVLQRFLEAEGALDYASNVQQGTDGWDTEVFSFAALTSAWLRAPSGQREHVTTYIREAPGFARLLVETPKIPNGEKWSVDTAEDLQRVRARWLEQQMAA